MGFLKDTPAHKFLIVGVIKVFELLKWSNSDIAWGKTREKYSHAVIHSCWKVAPSLCCYCIWSSGLFNNVRPMFVLSTSLFQRAVCFGSWNGTLKMELRVARKVWRTLLSNHLNWSIQHWTRSTGWPECHSRNTFWTVDIISIQKDLEAGPGSAEILPAHIQIRSNYFSLAITKP